MDTMREFLTNKCKLYCPPIRDLTEKFCENILSGKKKLLKVSKVKWIEFIVPKIPEFSAKNIWTNV